MVFQIRNPRWQELVVLFKIPRILLIYCSILLRTSILVSSANEALVLAFLQGCKVLIPNMPCWYKSRRISFVTFIGFFRNPFSLIANWIYEFRTLVQTRRFDLRYFICSASSEADSPEKKELLDVLACFCVIHFNDTFNSCLLCCLLSVAVYLLLAESNLWSFQKEGAGPLRKKIKRVYIHVLQAKGYWPKLLCWDVTY